MILALLGALTLSSPPQSTLPIVVEPISGVFPDVLRVEISGKFKRGPAFSLSVFYTGKTWKFSLEGDRVSVLDHDIGVNDVVVSGILIYSTGTADQRVIVVSIPFGDSLEDCYANGRHIHRRRMFLIRSGAVVSEHKSDHPQCPARAGD
jgi:hypothetical protein